MMYVLTGIVAAMLFGVASVSVYGYEGLMENMWIEYVFWWLIGTGVLLASVDSTLGLRCRVCRHMPSMPLCASLACR